MYYDPIEKFIVYVTHEQKAELMLDFIRAGLVARRTSMIDEGRRRRTE
jgi:hypothetical protein